METKRGWISIRESYPKEEGEFYVKDCTTDTIGKTIYNGYDFLNSTENQITHWRPIADKEEVQREFDEINDECDEEISIDDQKIFKKVSKIMTGIARSLNKSSLDDANFVSQIGMSVFINALVNNVKPEYLRQSFTKSVLVMEKAIDDYLENHAAEDDEDE